MKNKIFFTKVAMLMAAMIFTQPVIVRAVSDSSPKLSLITPIEEQTFDQTPDLTFSTSEPGEIIYGGDCSSETVSAVNGANTITLKSLEIGAHGNCTISIKGTNTGLTSSLPLNIPLFEVKPSIVSSPDSIPPELTLVLGVDSPTEDPSPSLVFNSDEGGMINYEGACFSMEDGAVEGDNTITMMNLPAGTYDNCKIRVSDAVGNISDALDIPSFMIIQTLNGPTDSICAGFSDLNLNDADCQAISYIKSVGAMTGNPDGTFAADGLLQRDQIAKIMLITFDQYDAAVDYCAGINPFPDLNEDSWAFQYVCQAKLLGIVKGYASGLDQGKFLPGRNVNRAEFLEMMVRELNAIAEVQTDGQNYLDVDENSWFGVAASFSKAENLFEGDKLYPANFTKRREVARVIYKLHLLGKI